MVDLSVKIGKLKLKNPVMVASGTFGTEYAALTDVKLLGAYIAKTITLRARTGNLPPRISETASGMLNSIGLENKGLSYFIKEKMPELARLGTPVIVSIAGDDEGEFVELTKKLSAVKKVAALELNLSCPNIKYGSREGLLAQDEKATYRIIKKVRAATSLTLIAKLSPCVTDITRIAKAAQAAGADAVSLVNTFPAMSADIGSGRPRLGNVTGGLSGPAIKPIALKMVWDTYNRVDIPIIGIGGIMNHKDAVEFMICGATAVQIGTANFVNPGSAIEIITGIKKYLDKTKISKVKQLTGSLKIG